MLTKRDTDQEGNATIAGVGDLGHCEIVVGYLPEAHEGRKEERGPRVVSFRLRFVCVEQVRADHDRVTER